MAYACICHLFFVTLHPICEYSKTLYKMNLSELTDKIYAEGVEKGNAEAKQIVEKANAKAAEIIAEYDV